MPRVNQLLNWVMGINFLCGIVFLLAIVYEYGFRISAAEYNLIHTVYHTIWVIFLVTTTVQIVFRQEDSSFKFTPWTWILTILLYLTLLPVVFKKPEETTGVTNITNMYSLAGCTPTCAPVPINSGRM